MRFLTGALAGFMFSIVASCGSGYLLHAPPAEAGTIDQKGSLLMAAQTGSVYDFTLDDIDGKPTPLTKYRGKVLLLVNTASKCGNTPQYSDLEAIY